MFFSFALPPLQFTLNEYLALDPETKTKLLPLQNKVIFVEISDLGIHFYASVTPDGLQLMDHCLSTPDTRIRGRLPDLIHVLWQSRTKKIPDNKKIVISGDLEFLQLLRDVFLHLDIDWEEILSKIFGDILAHGLMKICRQKITWVEDTATTLKLNLTEYLHYEKHVLPSPLEIEDFMRDVEVLRDDVERLEARLNRIT